MARTENTKLFKILLTNVSTVKLTDTMFIPDLFGFNMG